MANTISIWKRRWIIAKRIASKRFFRLSGAVNTLFQPTVKFCIKKGYRHASLAMAFNDTSNTDEWQKEVYLLAKDLLAKKNYQSVIDIGCGSGYKLIHYLGSYKSTGVEVAGTCQWLKQQYPQREWLQYDKVDPAALQADVIICSDVIEHVEDPDALMHFIGSIQSKQIIFSTPERDAVAGKNDYGPPENPSHYREWNAVEFKNYISGYFIIDGQRIFNGRSVTQVITCKK